MHFSNRAQSTNHSEHTEYLTVAKTNDDGHEVGTLFLSSQGDTLLE